MDWADKVKKLRAKADDPSVGEIEKQIILAKIIELMSDEAIREAVAAGIEVKPDEMTDKMVPFNMAYSAVMRDMYGAICRAFRCSAIQINSKTLHVFGFRSDLSKVDDMFSYILHFGDYELVSAMESRQTFHDSLKTFKTQFWRGYIGRVSQRLRDLVAASVKKAEDSSPGTSLVLVTREGHVRAEVSKVYPRLRTVTTRVSMGEGYRSGQAAGNRANLGQAGSIGGRRAIG